MSRKQKVIILGVVLLLLIVPTLGRFIYNELNDVYFRAQNFYFQSDKLKEEKATYQVNNYNGVDQYNVLINLNSFKNELLRSDTDISYDIEYTCSAKAICSTSKDDGIIFSTVNNDDFTISVIPDQQLVENDVIWIDVTATSSSPYIKEISAIFVLKVGYFGLSHEIIDSEFSPYLELKVTNTLDYYNVIQAFDSYQIDDRINISTYQALSQANKDKCVSSYIVLSFDPNLILVDMTSPTYLVSSNITTTTLSGFQYVNGFEFELDAQDSVLVRFYKKNNLLDYTFPIVNPSSIVSVVYQ